MNKSEIKAVLNVKQTEGMLNIKAKAVNDDVIIHDLNYLLIAIKQSPSGNLSNNKQEGKFVVKPDEEKLLSEISLNLTPDDQLKIYLFIRNEKENALISKDSVFINIDPNARTPTQKQTTVTVGSKKASHEDYSIKGIMVDNTKSKIGKDFFDMLYAQYSQSTEKYTFTITLRELPSFSNNGIISVEVEDLIIFTLRAIPNEEYLNLQLQLCLQQINNYNRNRGLLIKGI
ncbi:curli production assembly/transport protein CsgE [Sphingobacterium spiritivorum]|uniref:curli production assembly/transport protein CsgE n=1 Tax=Sphingobacterium spiritivorum TaxID=258 RepID=UPI001F3DA830|nr:curli production assembly/transport protein CsgE [Sphingobacterium spiritivorum]